MSVVAFPLAVGGVVTRVLEAGVANRDGTPVVLLHGAGARADRWRGVLARLEASGRRAAAVDFPGHGFAEKPPGYPYGVEAFTAFVHDLLDELGFERVHLVGTSIGGTVASLVALERPERIESLTVAGARLVAAEQSTAPGSDFADASADGVRAKLEFLVADPAVVTDELVHEERHVNASPGAAEALAALKAATKTLPPDIAARLAALDLPVLLCWGVADRWVPVELGHAAHRAIGRAPLVLFRGTAHAPMFERPDAFAEVLDQFLSDPGSLGTEVTER